MNQSCQETDGLLPISNEDIDSLLLHWPGDEIDAGEKSQKSSGHMRPNEK